MQQSHLQASLQEYNTALSPVDEKLNIVKKSERLLREFGGRMLIGIANRYGKDSNEYEKASGVRKGEQKLEKRKGNCTIFRIRW